MAPLFIKAINQEENELVKATFIIALSILLTGTDGDVVAKFEKEFAGLATKLTSHANYHVKLCAAIALARYYLNGTEPQIVKIICDATLNREACYAKEVPWFHGDINNYCNALLPLIGNKEQVVPALISSLDQAKGFACITIVESLLSVVFPNQHDNDSGDAMPLKSYTPLQQKVLEALAANNSIHAIGNVSLMLRRAGLPSNKEEIKAMLKNLKKKKRQMSNTFNNNSKQLFLDTSHFLHVPWSLGSRSPVSQ